MKKQYREWVGERIKELRKLHNLSQKEAALIMDAKIKAYQSYEECRAQPKISQIEAFCQAIKITVDKFLENSPAKQGQTTA